MDLSIIILTHNTRDITLRCLREVDTMCERSAQLRVEVIVVDNASDDGTAEALTSLTLTHCVMKYLRNNTNEGFSKGNNIGLAHATGKYVLYLNSDVMTSSTDHPVNLSDLVSYLGRHIDVGALTTSVLLPSGEIDPASHRGFPTLWRSVCYFLGVEKVVRKCAVKQTLVLKLCGGYHLLHEDRAREHEIDAGTAAFLLCRYDLLRELGGFDEIFFMYGEDLDLCYRMKEKGLKIMWVPRGSVLHLKYQSGLGSQDRRTRTRIRWYFYDAMGKFYRKHYDRVYCPCINRVVYGILWIAKSMV